MTDDYYDGLLTIVSLYREKKELLFTMIKKFDSPVTILHEVYLRLVLNKEIPAVESLPENKRRELWNDSIIKPTFSKRMAYCRAKYLLEII